MFSRSYKIFLLAIAFCGMSVFGQDPAPSPAATPYATDRTGTPPEEIKGVPQIAPDYSSDSRSPLPDLGRVGVDVMSQRPISIGEVIALALENNKDISVNRKEIQSSELRLKAARGVYEPRLTGQSYYDRSTIPNVGIFSTNRTTTQSGIVGNAMLQGYIPQFGTVVNATVNNNRTTTNDPISILSPQFNASIGFNVVQPLLRGRGIDQPRHTIEVAKRNISLSDIQFRNTTINTISNVQRTYWDLVFALRNLQVQRDSVADAKKQLEHSRRLVEEGQLAPIDIVASETQVALFEQSVYDALNLVTIAENALKYIIAPNRQAAIWNESLTPIERVEQNAPNIELSEALDLALKNRPELEANSVLRDINEIDRRFYKDQTRPQVNLIAGYTSSGVGGSINPDFSSPFPLPCQTDPTSPACQQQQANIAALTGSPYSNIFKNDYPSFRVGVQIDMPLFGNKTAKAQYGLTLVEKDKLEDQREQLEQGIEVDVRNAMQAVRSAEARLRYASVARENSQRQYESEQRKLDAGQSDIYLVLERQNALTNARSAELRAQTDLNKAIVDLHRATGNTLTINNIQTGN